MRCLITGIAGFIGSSIADELIEQGHEVEGIDDLSTGNEGNPPKGAYWRQGDIRRPADIAWSHKNTPDVIYHCAASYKDRGEWERDASTNVLGTINVVRLAQTSGAKLVYFQTSLCYGLKPASPVSPDAPLAPTGSYAISKTAGERYITDSGVDYVSLRLANVYGPRNLSGPVPAFYQRLSKGQPCTVVDSRRDFIFVNDLVQVAVKAATQGHGVYHVSTGRDIAIGEIYRAVCHAMSLDYEIGDPVPRGPDDAETILLDPTATQEEFGWKAQTTLISGIEQAVRWYASHSVEEVFTHLGPPAAARA